ncbi:MAG: hypothetical protein L6R40_004126 [Gallowayella cf. fulva]|nr:MAG: hypothetical protein L6R40_004126 [Xanthomendoza cf. fulva]
MRELRKLHLPQLVEARKREERSLKADTSMASTMAHPLQLSQSSASSDYPSPTTPTFSARGHSRLPSSNSSLASSPAMRDSMDAFGVGKRPLTEVREEPQEPDDDYDMVNGFANSPPDQDRMLPPFSLVQRPSGRLPSNADSTAADFFNHAMHSNFPISHADTLPSPPHYNLTDAEPDFGPSPSAKRRRADDFSVIGFTQRFGSRMPSLSRKWRQRKTANISISTQAFQERPSRANSSRTPSVANSFVEMDDQDYPLPPTPAMSISGHYGGDSPVTPIDMQRASAQEEDPEPDVQATTPLLPPVMANLSTMTRETPYQSPLQSPSVADPGPISLPHTPVETPQLGSLPSPPLSTRPSVSSFHRQRALSHTTLMPTADIPPLPLVPIPDPWADSLGHANFTIAPEPYLPTQFDVEACKQLRTDWETARRNFSRHMMRISEHYGSTSRIHKLTEEKWITIDAEWKRYTDLCLSRTADNGYEQALSQSQSSVAEPAPLGQLPSLNGPKSEGKFPKLGDEDIVGPMEVVASQLQQHQQQRKSSKRSFFRFLQGVFTPPNVNIFGKPSGRRAATL